MPTPYIVTAFDTLDELLREEALGGLMFNDNCASIRRELTGETDGILFLEGLFAKFGAGFLDIEEAVTAISEASTRHNVFFCIRTGKPCTSSK